MSILTLDYVSSVQFSSVAQPCWLFATLWTTACQATLSITNSWSILKLMSIEWIMLSNHLILCHPLLLPLSIFPNIRVFSNESALHISIFASVWPKYWSFSFSIIPSNEHPGLISFRMDLQSKGLSRILSLQSKGLSRVFSNTTVQKHRFFGAQLSLESQLSHPYMTTGKTIALTWWAFVLK